MLVREWPVRGGYGDCRSGSVIFYREILYSNRGVKGAKEGLNNETRGTSNMEVHTREGVTEEWGFQE